MRKDLLVQKIATLETCLDILCNYNDNATEVILDMITEAKNQLDKVELKKDKYQPSVLVYNDEVKDMIHNHVMLGIKKASDSDIFGNAVLYLENYIYANCAVYWEEFPSQVIQVINNASINEVVIERQKRMVLFR
jgi:hypothetical protein